MLDFNTQNVFPVNIMDLYQERLLVSDPGLSVKKRRLYVKDASPSVGLYCEQWSPDRTSAEIKGASLLGQHDATVNRYTVVVQGMVLDTNEESGLRKHYVLANYLRSTLAYDEPLAVALTQMKALVADDTIESLQRWAVIDQRFLSADLGAGGTKKWAYMSVLRINIETETRR